MAGRARHLPRHLHQRLLHAIALQPSWFTAEALRLALGPSVQRFRRREVATFLMQLVRKRLLTADGTSPRRFRRNVDADWQQVCENGLAEGDVSDVLKVPS